MEIVSTTGERFVLQSGVNCVGRGADNQIVINSEPVSRHHAELHWDGQHCLVVDLQSRNGTFLNGRRLVPYHPEPVLPGMQLCFGPAAIVSLAPGPATSPLPPPAVEGAGNGPIAPGPELILRAAAAALEPRKLALGALGLGAAAVVAAAVGLVATRLALGATLLAIATGLAGVLAVWLILTYVAGAIARLAYVELGHGERASLREGLGYARRHFWTFLLSPLALMAALVVLLAVEGLLLMVGRVDYVGELAVSLGFLPLVLLNLAVLVTGWSGLALVFPVVAGRGQGIGRTLREVIGTLRRAPGRVVAYGLLAAVSSSLLTVLCLYLTSSALYTSLLLTATAMEPAKFLAVLGGLPIDLGDLPLGLPPGNMSPFFGSFDPPATFGIARFLFGLSTLAVLALLLAVPQSFYLCSTCAVYIAVGQEAGRAQTAGAQDLPGHKACRYCGANLAYDQTYCPHCGQMQRS